MRREPGRERKKQNKEVAAAVGSRIAKAIKRMGYSQSGFASTLLGVRPGTLSNWVTGENECSYLTLFRIATLTQTSADELLGLPQRGPARLAEGQAHGLLDLLEQVRNSRMATNELLLDLENEIAASLAKEPSPQPPGPRAVPDKRSNR